VSKIIIGVDYASEADSVGIMCLSCYRVDCEHVGRIKVELEKRQRPPNALVIKTVADEDLDPPSYLPIREPLPPRIPDLCPDDEHRTMDIYNEATAEAEQAITKSIVGNRLITEGGASYANATIFADMVNHGPSCGCDDCEEERNR
jgi:hypothetical protein